VNAFLRITFPGTFDENAIPMHFRKSMYDRFITFLGIFIEKETSTISF
jgi:hypothetical protein